MELTKADKKRIEEETDKVLRRINIEATEYARLYERAYRVRLIEKLQCDIEASEHLENWGKRQ